MRKNLSLKFSALLFALLLGLSACNNPGGSSSSSSDSSAPVDPTPTDYYDEECFIPGERTVTTTKLVTYDAPNL